jgi:histidyl-tRNA synthetase
MAGQKIRSVTGMRDVLPIDIYRKSEEPWVRVGHFQLVEEAARDIFDLYGYREARTPILERTELFVRGIGEVTDIVGKEMFTFDDKERAESKGDRLSMRPENTASLMRAYVEHAVQMAEPDSKWFYIGPMFRRERPQKGRYRQFTQIGVEALGTPGPRVDVEQIELLHRWLSKCSIPFGMHLNTLGDEKCRPVYRAELQRYLRANLDKLCDECKRRVETNPIRVLDCKNPGCQQIAAGAPQMEKFLCDPCRAHFDGLRDGLSKLSVPFVVDPKLVRGLDYYTRTTYEAIATSGLGAQSTVAGGGRYDGLVRDLGGPDVPGIGFAAGVERLALLVAAQGLERTVRPAVFFAPLGPAEAARADALAQQLRAAGVAVEVSFRQSNVGNQLKRADALGARFALVLGELELQTGRAKLKELKTGATHEIALDELVPGVQKLMRETTKAG